MLNSLPQTRDAAGTREPSCGARVLLPSLLSCFQSRIFFPLEIIGIRSQAHWWWRIQALTVNAGLSGHVVVFFRQDGLIGDLRWTRFCSSTRPRWWRRPSPPARVGLHSSVGRIPRSSTSGMVFSPRSYDEPPPQRAGLLCANI